MMPSLLLLLLLLSGGCLQAIQTPTKHNTAFISTPPLFLNHRIKAATAAILLSLQPFTCMSNSNAADIEWTDRNRVAAEVWRTIDDLYYDRTFANNDWFKLRQQVVKQSYKTDDDLYNGLQKMTDQLGDKYTRYLRPAQYSVILNSAIGELTGVGLELLQLDDGRIKVNNVYDDSPAKESGILIGDIITNVDGNEVTAVTSPEEVAGYLRGRKDTKATLIVDRAGSSKDFAVLRKPLKIRGVSWSFASVKGKRVGVVVLKSFSTVTGEEVTRAMEGLHKQSPSLDYILLDMRNNGGGLLQGAVAVSNVFMPPGKIVVFVVDKNGRYDAMQTLPNGVISQDTGLPDLRTPLLVLVNKNTASAAEVLSAALKENGRARLVGEKTFGKGVIQTLQEVRGGGGVAVTIAKYETPLHNNINKIGIAVDVATPECSDATPAEVCLADVL